MYFIAILKLFPVKGDDAGPGGVWVCGAPDPTVPVVLLVVGTVGLGVVAAELTAGAVLATLGPNGLVYCIPA